MDKKGAKLTMADKACTLSMRDRIILADAVFPPRPHAHRLFAAPNQCGGLLSRFPSADRLLLSRLIPCTEWSKGGSTPRIATRADREIERIAGFEVADEGIDISYQERGVRFITGRLN